MIAGAAELTPETFEAQALAPGQRALVYFWGPQCPNCEVFARHLPGLQDEIAKLGIRLYKVNAYAHTELATRFGLHGIPTFLLIRDGRVAGRMTSFQGDEYFLAVLRENLAAG